MGIENAPNFNSINIHCAIQFVCSMTKTKMHYPHNNGVRVASSLDFDQPSSLHSTRLPPSA